MDRAGWRARVVCVGQAARLNVCFVNWSYPRDMMSARPVENCGTYSQPNGLWWPTVRWLALLSIVGVSAACDGGEIGRHAQTRLISKLRTPRLGELVESAAARKVRCAEPAVSSEVLHADLDADALAERVEDAPQSLGSAAVGLPTRGTLWGGVRLTSSEHVEAVTLPYAWATKASVESIERAARIVRCRFDESPRLHVGSLSRERGGPLFPHRSHQNGLDADVGYFYTDGSVWYQYATADNLDVERTWALIEALYEGGNVEYLFIDRSVQELLREHAERVSPELMVVLFDGTPEKQPLIRHARGHRTHLHVRFDDSAAKANAKRLAAHIDPRYRFMAYRR